jgi:hypothetical protein
LARLSRGEREIERRRRERGERREGEKREREAVPPLSVGY